MSYEKHGNDVTSSSNCRMANAKSFHEETGKFWAGNVCTDIKLIFDFTLTKQRVLAQNACIFVRFNVGTS